MKTIILVSLPGSILKLDASDFPTGTPVEGRHYEFAGAFYKVTEIIETLGSRSADGIKISGYVRLMTFIDAISQNVPSVKQQFVKSLSVGAAGSEDVLSTGGIIIGQIEDKSKIDASTTEALHVMFVHAVPTETKQKRMPTIRLQSFAGPEGSDETSAASDDTNHALDALTSHGLADADAFCTDGYMAPQSGIPDEV